MTTRPTRLAFTVSTLAISAFGLAVMTGPAAMAAQTTQSAQIAQTAQSTVMHHAIDRTQLKGAAGDSCDPGDGDTGTLDDVGDCIDN
jgi:hypothetical protein